MTFLLCAISAPSLFFRPMLPPHTNGRAFHEFVEMYEKKYPAQTVVLVNKDEQLLNHDAKEMPFTFGNQYRLWTIKRSA